MEPTSTFLSAGVIVFLACAGLVLLIGIIFLLRKMSVQDAQTPAPLPLAATRSTDAMPASVEDKVRDALRRGNKIEAIKEIRLATNVGLKEAKDMVEAFERGHPLPNFQQLEVQPAPLVVPADLRGQVIELLQQGKKINAIALYRQATGAGLKEAKEAVEEIELASGNIL